ncbi:cytochrome o ubiquinol oxidase subunit IV [Rhizobium leucaenae]|uniref:Cytochrome bo(3) ubiquinol oxidase subunit 4 n=1 Tax=Rhizobium leucaenae TaxID=29450 RepID=A0A7W6ZZC8_9HYPH|nr:cytochrome o ubiquinol oxidase subunit IV [Rhizobium leucaenae]MBB4570928.1 cytochrome o ubiquinol oxidase operon protein cyoD [Rhizobium leucaenae]MBB6303590.1 cytochrome o ubiquinol oxidase operon protein cyoD [Rhizobium leucaenae]
MSDFESDPHLRTGIMDHREDHSPGDEPLEDSGHWIRNANLGLGFSIILTVAAFLLAGSNLIYGPAIPVALLVLAIAQMGVHLVFFLHITTGPDNTNNVLALVFGVLVVFLIVIGSIWIMDHLHQNMQPMPMEQMMQMQQ